MTRTNQRARGSTSTSSGSTGPASKSHKKASRRHSHGDSEEGGGSGGARKRQRSSSVGRPPTGPPSAAQSYAATFLTEEESFACYFPLPPTPAPPPSAAFLQRLHDELDAYNASHVPTAAMTSARWQLIAEVRLSARELWGSEIDVLPFGSFVTGLYIESSDVDLVVMHVSCGRKQIAQFLRTLGNRLRARGVAKEVSLIPSARVPLLKYVDVASGLPVDVSLGIVDGVLSANLMKKQSELHPAFRPLTLFLKAFMQARGLADVFKGGISSYILQCMILFHLQVQDAMHAASKPAAASPSPASSAASSLPPISNLGYLLFTFFELFGCTFSYELHGIRINDLKGGRVECYLKRSTPGRFQYDRPHLLSIEDPIQKERDIGGGCFAIKRVQRCFALAREFLCREPKQQQEQEEADTSKEAASSDSSDASPSAPVADNSRGTTDTAANGFVIDTVGNVSVGSSDIAAARAAAATTAASSSSAAAAAGASSVVAAAAAASAVVASPSSSSFSSSFGFLLRSLLSLPVRYSLADLRRAAVKQPGWLPVVDKLERIERLQSKKEAKTARREERTTTSSSTSGNGDATSRASSNKHKKQKMASKQVKATAAGGGGTIDLTDVDVSSAPAAAAAAAAAAASSRRVAPRSAVSASLSSAPSSAAASSAGESYDDEDESDSGEESDVEILDAEAFGGGKKATTAGDDADAIAAKKRQRKLHRPIPIDDVELDRHDDDEDDDDDDDAAAAAVEAEAEEKEEDEKKKKKGGTTSAESSDETGRTPGADASSLLETTSLQAPHAVGVEDGTVPASSSSSSLVAAAAPPPAAAAAAAVAVCVEDDDESPLDGDAMLESNEHDANMELNLR